MKARFSPDVLSVDKDLLQLEGKQIDFSRLQMPINIEHLRHHWNKFFNRHVNPFIKNALNKKSTIMKNGQLTATYIIRLCKPNGILKVCPIRLKFNKKE